MSEHPKGYCPVFGNYPREYNRAVHGPYYPWVNYGPKDTHFSEVKLGDFKNWLMRRQKTPAAAIAAFSRMSWTWSRKWWDLRYGPISKGLFQLFIMMSTANFIMSYGYYKMHRNHKYHW